MLSRNQRQWCAITRVAVTSLCLVTLVTGGAWAANYVIYSYDALGRLTTTEYDSGMTTEYNYDSTDNRTAQTTTIGPPPS